MQLDLQRMAKLSCFGFLLVAAKVASSQELSEARFVGALDGAATACAKAFPDKSDLYRMNTRRIARCQYDDVNFESWHSYLRSSPATRDEYSKGFSQGQGSLAKKKSAQTEQCHSLLNVPCQEPTTAQPVRDGRK